MGLGYLSFFIILGMKDFLLNNENIDWINVLVLISFVFIFVTYKIVTRKKTVNSLIKADVENNELLKFRLELIEREWNF